MKSQQRRWEKNAMKNVINLFKKHLTVPFHYPNQHTQSHTHNPDAHKSGKTEISSHQLAKALFNRTKSLWYSTFLFSSCLKVLCTSNRVDDGSQNVLTHRVGLSIKK